MKKRFLSMFLILIMVTALTACNSTSNKDSAKEYDVEEFGKMLNETDELFEKESEYLTTDELYGEKGYKLYEKCSNETGLPFNANVTIRGKKVASSVSGFELTSSDNEYSIDCFFGTETQSDKNISLFIKDGENVIVTGIISEQEDSYGCLTNVSFDSPKEIDITYNNNLAEVLADCTNSTEVKIVSGEIDLVQPLDQFENATTLLAETGDNIEYEHKDYYFDSVVTLSGTESGSISFMYDSQKYNLKKGDKVTTQGYVDDLMHIKNADGSVSVLWGIMGNVYDIYKFE